MSNKKFIDVNQKAALDQFATAFFTLKINRIYHVNAYLPGAGFCHGFVDSGSNALLCSLVTENNNTFYQRGDNFSEKAGAISRYLEAVCNLDKHNIDVRFIQAPYLHTTIYFFDLATYDELGMYTADDFSYITMCFDTCSSPIPSTAISDQYCRQYDMAEYNSITASGKVADRFIPVALQEFFTGGDR